MPADPASVSYSVSERTRELGIRIALGAESGDVRALVLQQGMLPVLAGVGLGIVGAEAITRVLKSFLFGVNAADPTTFILMALVMTDRVGGLLHPRRPSDEGRSCDCVAV